MFESTKGKSPFYPGQPVPVEFFTGRDKEIQKIARAIREVELGKPRSIFLTGEYGIGKSSLAGYMKYYAEKHNNLLGIYVLLGGASTIESLATRTVESVLKNEYWEPSLTEKIRNFLSKYVGKQELFGIHINFEALKADGPNLSRGFLPFLHELYKRLEKSGIKGIMLIFDEINGLAKAPEFSHFIKSLIDENALNRSPLPLLLMLCGVEERRREMIRQHQPIERIFDIVQVQPMSRHEMEEFFNKAFGSVGIQVNQDAMNQLCKYSAGFPKIMHIIGDAVFWIDRDNVVDINDAFQGILIAAEDIGKKFVDQQVYRALRSKDYHSILNKLGRANFDLAFKKKDIEEHLTSSERKKFNNFLQRMKKLKVIKSGDERGEYIFTNRLIRLYILLNSIEQETKKIKNSKKS